MKTCVSQWFACFTDSYVGFGQKYECMKSCINLFSIDCACLWDLVFVVWRRVFGFIITLGSTWSPSKGHRHTVDSIRIIVDPKTKEDNLVYWDLLASPSRLDIACSNCCFSRADSCRGMAEPEPEKKKKKRKRSAASDANTERQEVGAEAPLMLC